MSFKNGFSLIEILTVIVIIGILTALGLPYYYNYAMESHVAKLKPTLDKIHNKLIINYHRYNRMTLEADDGSKFSIKIGTIEDRVGVKLQKSIKKNWKFHTQGSIYYYLNQTGEYRLDGHLLIKHTKYDLVVDMEFSDENNEKPFKIYIKK